MQLSQADRYPFMYFSVDISKARYRNKCCHLKEISMTSCECTMQLVIIGNQRCTAALFSAEQYYRCCYYGTVCIYISWRWKTSDAVTAKIIPQQIDLWLIEILSKSSLFKFNGILHSGIAGDKCSVSSGVM